MQFRPEKKCYQFKKEKKKAQIENKSLFLIENDRINRTKTW